MFERIPAKGAILSFAVLALSLSLTARLADRGVDSAKELRKNLESSGQASPDLQAALPADFAAALAGDLPNGKRSVELALGEEEDVGDDEKGSRPPGWVYPAFGAPGPGGHGVPMGAVSRNIGLRFVDGEGAPVVPDAVRGTQSGDDGEFEVLGFRSSETLPWWTIGSPALTEGARAAFRLVVIVDGEAWEGTFKLNSVPSAIDVDLSSPVELRERR